MIITLIGMSNAGKSYWARKLKQLGFTHVCCDDLIEQKLDKELKSLGYRGIADVAKWLGQPYDRNYKSASSKYLRLETEILQEFINSLNENSTENMVLDTTGSVIHAGPKIMKTLAKLTTMVYLDVPSSIQKQMYKLYLSNPKPVIWGKAFRILKGESESSALARCYPELLEYRTKLYKQYSQIELDYFLLRDSKFTAKDFLERLENK